VRKLRGGKGKRRKKGRGERGCRHIVELDGLTVSKRVGRFEPPTPPQV